MTLKLRNQSLRNHDNFILPSQFAQSKCICDYIMIRWIKPFSILVTKSYLPSADEMKDCLCIISTSKFLIMYEEATLCLGLLRGRERFKIVIGTAKGLAHLNHSFCSWMIHYKPSNILFDENLNPKILDFGLARLLSKIDKHVVCNRSQSAPGNVAPELACRSSRVNEKCDV